MLGRAAKDSSKSSKRNWLFGCIAILAIFSLVHLSREPTFTSSSPSSIRPGNTVFFQSHDEADLSSDCVARLDALDLVSNERRQVRNHIISEAKAVNKNIYDYLWKSPTPDAKSREKEKINHQKLLFDLFEPEATCITEERFGGDNSDQRYHAFGDGPKFVCGVDYIRESYKNSINKEQQQGQHQPCLVYSIGSNNNIKFEKAVKQHMECEIHTFDPTLKTEFIGSEYAIFHPWGLGIDNKTVHFKQGTSTDATFKTMSLEHILKELQHMKRKIDIFKIDCEGCEYDAMPVIFDAIVRQKILQMDQILIELHPVSYEKLTDFFTAADKAGYRITHKERNGWGCGGTRCVEYALVSESFLRRATAAAMC